ncbi:uncharacterized protein LOC110109264 [Dendrobium catenatum]|uniref:uncharacterized protein LOC110109264 n=1 Tax=Dendrobium catenatum TaxID=906689 RepID=UPI00109F36D9|nr:uncharacterized protein LOC110109264 [Dendrobium catenatum]
MESFSRKEVDCIAGKEWEFVFEPAIGNAGGILILWKVAVLSFQLSFKTHQCIMGKVSGSNGLLLEVAVVYANKDRYVRRHVWEDISKAHNLDAPLLVGGDFNCIMSQEEKKGGKAFHFSGAAGDMADFMAANDLVDPGFSGPAFTWTNNKDARSIIFSRLDRFLVSSPILDSFQGLKAWQLVWDKWRVDDAGNEALKLRKKCQRTLKALFFWSRDKIKMLNQLKEDLDREIKFLQDLECSPAGLTEVQAEALRYKVQLLNSTLARIMSWWKQRAKVKWLEEGDENTRFFHSMASARKRSNFIDVLKQPDGSIVTEQMQISEMIHCFFEKKWCGNAIVEDGWPSLGSHCDILVEVVGFLESTVTKEEI